MRRFRKLAIAAVAAGVLGGAAMTSPDDMARHVFGPSAGAGGHYNSQKQAAGPHFDRNTKTAQVRFIRTG